MGSPSNTGQAQIGVTGLAVMGRNLARNFARNGYAVALHNRTPARTRELVDEFGHEGRFVPTESPAECVAALQRPRRLVTMVQAGPATDTVITEFASHMDEGDIIVDAGNAHFADTIRRERALAERGIHFVGTGVSGGEEGALHGPSIMPGGSEQSWRTLGPMLEAVAARAPDGSPCVTHVGPDAAGHFTKMVHNGIEYADMQLIAEAYDLLRRGAGMSCEQIAEVFREWNRGRLDSFLIDITAEVLAHRDPETGAPFVDVVLDRAEQKGTGRWTVRQALDLGVPVNSIAEAVFARSLSGHTDQRDAARGLPGPQATVDAGTAQQLAEDTEKALYASKIVAYAQGFHQIAAGSAENEWNIDRGRVAAIWRAGCIIRARFLDDIRAAFDARPDLASLLGDPSFAAALSEAQEPWRRVVSTSATLGIPTPGFSAALAYYDALRADPLPAALTQAQRDFFGAHTYRRTDREGTFHTRWAEQGRPEERVD
ncbi:NADP-dependent phosphogluconate dehydrogenase [Bounagaea algeriensis]